VVCPVDLASVLPTLALLTYLAPTVSRLVQDIKGSDIFSDDSSGTGPAAGAVPGLSDAKKKALYSTSVFEEDGPAAAPQVHTHAHAKYV